MKFKNFLDVAIEEVKRFGKLLEYIKNFEYRKYFVKQINYFFNPIYHIKSTILDTDDKKSKIDPHIIMSGNHLDLSTFNNKKGQIIPIVNFKELDEKEIYETYIILALDIVKKRLLLEKALERSYKKNISRTYEFYYFKSNINQNQNLQGPYACPVNELSHIVSTLSLSLFGHNDIVKEIMRTKARTVI